MALTLFHRMSGPDDRPALLLLHGFMGSHADWTPLLPVLESKFRCIAVDLPGHGRSPLPEDWGPDPVHTVCTALIDLLQQSGMPTVRVLGYSLGGRVAMHLISTRPELLEAAVIESANPGIAAEGARAQRREMDDRLAAQLEQFGIAEFLESWYRLPLFGSLVEDPAYPMLIQHRLRNDPACMAELLRRLSPGRTPPLWDLLAATEVPTLFVAGDEDEKYVRLGKQLAAMNPRIRFERIPGSAHSVHIQQPGAFARSVIGFFQKVEESHD